MMIRIKIVDMQNLFKTLVILIISITTLQSCNQTKNDNTEKSYQNEQAEKVLNKTVSLSVKPDNFKLFELPELVKVTMTNNTNDTITTGLYYRIEFYENNEWKVISPEQFFEDLGWTLKPSDFHIFETKLLTEQIDYKPGKYRIVKYYLKSDYQNTKEELNIYAEFNIE